MSEILSYTALWQLASKVMQLTFKMLKLRSVYNYTGEGRRIFRDVYS